MGQGGDQRKSQNATILAHLREHGTITSWESIQLYKITRLSGRIYDLKEEGHAIDGEMRHENGKHFKVYWLELPKGQLEFSVFQTKTPVGEVHRGFSCT